MLTRSCNLWNRQGNNGVKTPGKLREHTILWLNNDLQSLKMSALSTLNLLLHFNWGKKTLIKKVPLCL